MEGNSRLERAGFKGERRGSSTENQREKKGEFAWEISGFLSSLSRTAKKAMKGVEWLVFIRRRWLLAR